MNEELPLQVLRPVLGAVESAREYVRGRAANGMLHDKLRAASKILNDLMNLESDAAREEQSPFWYTLYEGLVEKYIQLKMAHRFLKQEHANLKEQHAQLYEKYWDAVSKLDAMNKGEQQAEEW